MHTRDRSPVPKPSRQGAVVLAGLVACALLSAVVRKPATIERDVVDWACNFVYTSCEDGPQGATSNTQVFYEALRQTATNFSSEDPALIQTISAIVEKIKATSLAGSELSASTSAANATAAVAATEQRSLPDGMGPERRAGQLSREMNNTIAAAFEGQQHTRSAAAPASGGGAMMVTAVVIAVLVILALLYRRTRARQLKAEKAPVIEAPPLPPLAPRPQPQAGSGAGSHSLPVGAVGAAPLGQPHACASCGVSSFRATLSEPAAAAEADHAMDNDAPDWLVRAASGRDIRGEGDVEEEDQPAELPQDTPAWLLEAMDNAAGRLASRVASMNGEAVLVRP